MNVGAIPIGRMGNARRRFVTESGSINWLREELRRKL